jgi:hypothetical protein
MRDESLRVLVDQGTPVPLRRFLEPHVVEPVYERGWSTLKNGELLHSAMEAGFDAMVTTDQNVPHQQNLQASTLAVVILSTTDWNLIRLHVELVRAALTSRAAGQCVVVTFPASRKA